MTLESLAAKNPVLKFYKAADNCPLFKKVNGDFWDYVSQSEKLTIADANSYIAGDADLLNLASVKWVEEKVFAELPVQAGWCFGGGRFMNGMEWHKSSEVVVACTDCVLLIGDYADIVADGYDSVKAVALFLKKGEAVELLPMTLHLAPLPVEGYFKVGIILPAGTNAPLKKGIDGTLRAVNKWLLVHKDNKRGIELGGKIGVTGVNITLNV
jgi:hypothetical protein